MDMALVGDSTLGCEEPNRFMLQPRLRAGAGWGGTLLCVGSIRGEVFGMSRVSLPAPFCSLNFFP